MLLKSDWAIAEIKEKFSEIIYRGSKQKDFNLLQNGLKLSLDESNHQITS